MPRSSIPLQQIREELAWVSQPPDQSKCGCRAVQCSTDHGHAAGMCSEAPTTRLWTFRWEFFCAECREYQ
jgi:hypothetical protein